MNRRNNTSIQQTEPPKSSIEVITRLVVTEKTHDTQMYESHYEEENVEILEEESPCEEGIQDLQVENFNEEVFKPHIVVPQQILDDHNYDVLIRPTTCRPTLAILNNALQIHLAKPSCVRTTCVNASYHAKLEGISSQDPWIVSYDTYYGSKPLFDKRRFKSSRRH